MALGPVSCLSWRPAAVAYKYYDRIHKKLGVDVLREDEMECLIMGELSSDRRISVAICSPHGF